MIAGVATRKDSELELAARRLLDALNSDTPGTQAELIAAQVELAKLLPKDADE
jgi:hypothetical protein